MKVACLRCATASAGTDPADADAADGIKEGIVMKGITLRIKAVRAYLSIMKAMTMDVSTIKGAIGTFTTIHAMGEAIASVTYWLVVWPTAAGTDRSSMRSERKGVIGFPRRFVGARGRAGKPQGEQDETVMHLLLQASGSSYFGTNITLETDVDAKFIAGISYDITCAALPRPLGGPTVPPASPSPGLRTIPREGRRGPAM